TVLFGGTESNSGGGTFLADTWEWDGTSWSPASGTLTPPGRYQHALAYDSARGRTVLFGGSAGPAFNYLPIQDTWEWDGTDWTQRVIPLSPPARANHVLAFDSGRGRTVLFGNLSMTNTWEYGPVTPGSWVPFGTGCAGSVGVPVLAAGSELRPYPGNDVRVEVAPVPANAAVLFSLGVTRTQWDGLSQAFALDNLGLRGYALLASGDATLLRVPPR